ncbi:hypothetical protein BGZ65_000253, partial [Modicella reniformis]
LISEYRLNSGPVLKDGDFELYNPDTFPPEFRSYLMLLSMVILDTMRPVDDKAFYKEFPEVALKKSKVPSAGGLHISAGPNGRPSQLVATSKAAGSSSSLNADGCSTNMASLKAAAVSVVDVGPTAAAPPKATIRTRSTTLATSAPSSTPSAAPARAKRSRWGSFLFKK